MIQRPHQILSEFANQGYKSILYNINSETREIINVKQNLYIYNKIIPPINKENKRVIWISYPPIYKQIKRIFNEDLIVFDCIDYPEGQFQHWKTGMDQLRENANFIFVTSQALYELNKGYKEKTQICRNATDFNHFTKARTLFCDLPEDIKTIKGPVVGYFGAVAEWIDWDLIAFLAEKNQFSLVFIGPLFKIPKIPIEYDNLFYLGEKEYKELPAYLQRFDACIIPFLKDKLTAACNPVKMYEYLSAGKPVITTDIEECRIEMVKHSNSYDDFYNNVMDCLKDTSYEENKKRIQFAFQNSWENRVRYIRSVIEPFL